jgi:hypothetical protein
VVVGLAADSRAVELGDDRVSRKSKIRGTGRGPAPSLGRPIDPQGRHRSGCPSRVRLTTMMVDSPNSSSDITKGGAFVFGSRIGNSVTAVPISPMARMTSKNAPRKRVWWR